MNFYDFVVHIHYCSLCHFKFRNILLFYIVISVTLGTPAKKVVRFITWIYFIFWKYNFYISRHSGLSAGHSRWSHMDTLRESHRWLSHVTLRESHKWLSHVTLTTTILATQFGCEGSTFRLISLSLRFDRKITKWPHCVELGSIFGPTITEPLWSK